MFDFGFFYTHSMSASGGKMLSGISDSHVLYLPSVPRSSHPTAGSLLWYNANFSMLNYCRTLEYPEFRIWLRSITHKQECDFMAFKWHPRSHLTLTLLTTKWSHIVLGYSDFKLHYTSWKKKIWFQDCQWSFSMDTKENKIVLHIFHICDYL